MVYLGIFSFLFQHSGNGRLGAVEQLRDFLQGRALCLDKQEPDAKACLRQLEVASLGSRGGMKNSPETFYDQNGNVDEVEPPLQGFKTNWVDILVEHTSGGRSDLGDCETHGARLVGHDFSRISDSKTWPGKARHSIEEKDHGNDSVTGSLVTVLFV